MKVIILNVYIYFKFGKFLVPHPTLSMYHSYKLMGVHDAFFFLVKQVHDAFFLTTFSSTELLHLTKNEIIC